MSHSQISGFYRLDVAARRQHLAELMGLSQDDLRILSGEDGLSEAHADRMVENALGVIGLPLGLCVNMQVAGEDFLVPMAVEEPSVVAACSFAAKLLRAGGGVEAAVSEPVMIGQIQIMEVPDVAAAEAALLGAKAELLALANARHPHLLKAGGGAMDLELSRLPKLEASDPLGDMLVAHLVVDVRDAMGANAINSMCERLAPRVAELSGGRVGLRILSNLTDRRTVTVVGKVPFSALEGRGKGSGEALARAIEEASVFAERCPYRAATHNKGIMNGVDAVLIAFGQDWRAVEAGAHAYAAKDGRYTALARWRVEDGHLVGRMTLPMAVGTVGGVFKVHPTVQVACKVAGVHTTAQLASVVAASGLAQNLAAIRALAAEGIQSGHMRLHARNVAAEAGAEGDEVHRVAEHIADLGQVNIDAARAALAELRTQDGVAAHAPEALDVKARFEALAATYMERIVALTAEVMRQSPGGDGTLPEMCLYHYQTGGKRLRALLPLLTAEAMGEPAERMVPFGAACEMLHNATLVHDDLQDGDEVRRGMPTVWTRFGMPQAVNLGDAMFYYTLLLEQRLEVPVARRERAAKRILQETLRVIDGQEREFGLKETKDLTLEGYFRMVEGKTSGLFALPMAGAAEVLGASPEVVEGLAEAARHMGVLFQIQDDVLDLYGEKGRDMRGSDIAEGKRSALVVHALEHATAEDRAWLVEVLDRPRAETTEADVRAVIALFERTGSLRFTLDEMRRRQAAALEIPALVEHPRLLELVEGFSDLFLAPIRFLMDDPDAVVATLLAEGAVPSGPLTPEDHAFCFEMLPKVSRTFALSIGALPESLRDAVGVAYLLCRVVDTIEDDARLDPADRVRLFDAFDLVMTDDRASTHALEALSERTGVGVNEDERRLMTSSGAVLRVFRALSPAQRAAVRPHVLEMSQGMREYTARADAAGGKLRLRDLEDLERYCFYVAGTVGNLLTALFEQIVPVLSESTRSAIRERAVSFGLGLQMVNIVKDVATDLQRGDIFLPEALAARYGIKLQDLLAPQKRNEALAVVRAVTGRAREHLDRAVEYTVLWPAEQAAPVRLFCAVPLALALASLSEVDHGQNTLKPGFVPKISREMVAQLFMDIQGALGDDDALLELFRRSAQPPAPEAAALEVHVPARPPIPTPRPSASPARRASASVAADAPAEVQGEARKLTGKVLVTGAAGHLGANLVRRLLRDGQEVRVLLRQGSNNAAMDGLPVERVYGDLRDPEAARRAAAGCESVYHCAAAISTQQGDERLKKELFDANVLGTRHLLAAAAAAGVARTVVTGSFAAGHNGKLPYAQTKELMELEALRAVAEGQDVVIATSCAILGPHDYKPSQMGQTLLDYAHGKLRAYIPGGVEFVSAADVAEGHVLAMRRGRAGHKYTLSTEYASVDQLMELFEEVSGRRRPKLKLPPGVMAPLAEVSSFVMSNLFPARAQRFTPEAVRLLRQQRRADITKARVELGYTPTDLRTAIHDAYADFARRGLVPGGPTMVTAPDVAPRATTEGKAGKKDDTAAA